MLFNSLQFAIFFPIVTLLYFLLRGMGRVSLLLAASCLFYMAFVPKFILILVFLILVDYAAGILIEDAPQGRRRLLLAISLGANVGILGFFKYFNFFQTNVAALAETLGWHYPLNTLSVILPIGLSFHTFQSMSYTIEVYRGNFRAERSLPHFALYVLFYPQLVAGPIERPQNLLHQFREEHPFSWANLGVGLQLMAVGLFKKVLIADRLALLVNEAYARPAEASGAQLLLATYFFAVQIYCDFSGYTDIARGAARVMGVEMMTNFAQPYLASSLTDFWRRWHISLSTWFRDYLYYPLGGSRVSVARHCLNLLVVFLVSGLWHGASWNFVAWGALHGVGMAGLVATAGLRSRLTEGWGSLAQGVHQAAATFLTFNFVCLTWVFFRATDLTQATGILHRIFSDFRVTDTLHAGLSRGQFVLAVALIVLLLATEVLQHRKPAWVQRAFEMPAIHWTAWYLALVGSGLLALFSPQQVAQTFIYFQF